MHTALWELIDDLFDVVERRWKTLLWALPLAAVLIFLAISASHTDVWTYAFWHISDTAESLLSEVIRNVGLLAAGLIGLGLGIWPAVTAYQQTQTGQRQAETAEQGHMTDRFNKAVKLLGSPEETIRVGTVYALWRLSEDSPDRDQRPVWDILSYFVRQPPIVVPSRRRTMNRWTMSRWTIYRWIGPKYTAIFKLS